uniref:beta-N-acetylhexosaminidase n=1 Tax=Clastoptera arizonana TaxID=38151 RepID=A0A1B6CXU7_9HEMI
MFSIKLRGKKLGVVLAVFMMLFIVYYFSINDLDTKNEFKKNGFIFEKSNKHQMSFNSKLVANDGGWRENDQVPIKYNGKIGDKESMIISSSKKPLFSNNRIVHLDLKGAPPKISYYAEFFPLIRSLGATGVIIEYEDMFPYSRTELSAMNAYSKLDVESILKLAKNNELDVIPLIQTFGHLEFVLKLEKYKNHREINKYPQVICPSKNMSIILLKEMIDDVVSMHPNSKYLHIGCDEVYYLGDCYSCVQKMVKEKLTKQQLFLNHVTMLSRYIKEKYPYLTTLTWDDEFRKFSLQELIDSGIGSLVEPVVWKYTPTIDMYLPEEMWDKYAKVFGNVWVASAFKGATGPEKIITDITYHLENHKAWVNLVNVYTNKINFKGIVMTGWQRYDHFAILCELLPVGIPSLATNLIYVNSNNIDLNMLLDKVESTIKCGSGFFSNTAGSHCSFVGSGIYDAAIKLNDLNNQIKVIMESSVVKGWFTQYNIDTGFSNPSHVEEATLELDRFKMDLLYLEQDVIKSMNEVYNSDTVKEWIDTNIKPLMMTLQTMWASKEKLLERQDWPRRPFSSSHNEDL